MNKTDGKFNDAWLEDTRFSSCLRKDNTSNLHFYCKACLKSNKIGDKYAKSLEQHMSGSSHKEKHKSFLMTKTATIGLFMTKESKEKEKDKPVKVEPQSNQPDLSSSMSLAKKCSIAEVRSVLHSIGRGLSFSSLDHDPTLFKVMFPKNELITFGTASSPSGSFERLDDLYYHHIGIKSCYDLWKVCKIIFTCFSSQAHIERGFSMNSDKFKTTMMQTQLKPEGLSTIM